MRFEYVLVQQLKTKDWARTFFRLFSSAVPPALGWRIQQFEWNEEGDVVDDVYINPHGVCFVSLQLIDCSSHPEILADYLEDFRGWIEDSDECDFWRNPLDAFRLA